MTTAFLPTLPLIDWITSIPLDDWPQQTPVDGQLRPAMVNDPLWHDFGARVQPVIDIILRDHPGHVARRPMLSIVMPGHTIPMHTDDQDATWVYRVHLPLVTNDAAYFVTPSGTLHMEAHAVYFVDTREPHSVVNDGPTPRIHFMVDLHTA